MNQLQIIEQKAPAELYAAGAIRTTLDAIASEARALAGALDPATPAGRKELASIAYKVAQSKSALDSMGKGLTEESRKLIEAVNAERKIVREELDALKDEIRKPVTEFEEREKARVLGHETALDEIAGRVAGAIASRDLIDIEEAEIFLEEIDISTFEEFGHRAETERDSGLHRLAKAGEEIRAELAAKAKAKAARAKAELARAEAEAKAREEREARIAAEAAEKAQAEAEAKAKAEREAESARVAEEARKAEEAREAERRAEAERLAALEREKAEAERRAKEAEERHKRELEEAAAKAKAEAEAKETARLAAEAEAKAAAEKKAANETHRAKVRRAAAVAIADFIPLAAAMGVAEEIIAAIESGDIEHVTLNF